MKKSILVAAAALLVATTVVKAEVNTTAPSFSITESVVLEVNPFCMAIMKGDIETVRKLIEFGEDVNKKSNGMTPAIFAARYNKVDILELLIANGADIRVTCDKGRDIVKHAEMCNAKGSLALLDKTAKEKKLAKKNKRKNKKRK